MRPFRFGVNLHDMSTMEHWTTTCRRAEELAYDVILVPDHLGLTAPFPAVVAAAQATTEPRVGTFVLNTGFWNPTLLARDVATADQLTMGRLELGLGTGYVHSEFTAAGLDPGTPKDRVDQLERTVVQLEEIFLDSNYLPRPVQRPRPTLLIGGNGNRVLRIAASYADTVAFTCAAYDPSAPGGLRAITAVALDERVAFFEDAARQHNAQIERNLLIQQVIVTDDREAALASQAHLVPYLTLPELLDLPIVLAGTPREIIDQVRGLRERYGFSYLTVLHPYMEDFGPIARSLRGT